MFVPIGDAVRCRSVLALAGRRSQGCGISGGNFGGGHHVGTGGSDLRNSSGFSHVPTREQRLGRGKSSAEPRRWPFPVSSVPEES